MAGWQILQGDARERLAGLDAESIACCVTSPPYFGLRSYGTEAQVWGGEVDCEHAFGEEMQRGGPAGVQGSTSQRAGRSNIEEQIQRGRAQGAYCRCGAWRGELGSEPTIGLYVEHMVEAFAAVHRVLRKDATLWLNIGDSYAAGKSGRSDHGSADPTVRLAGNTRGAVKAQEVKARKATDGLKPKDLCLIPFRLALALQEAGWWVRQVCIWDKVNPLPESVTDRPTTAHEYIFLLAKSATYYYDAEAVRQSAKFGRREWPGNNYRNAGTAEAPPIHTNGGTTGGDPLTGRNLRSVFTIPTQAYPAAHFATFPEAIPKLAIFAGCPVGGTVLDPFAGSGTTGQVAVSLGRSFVGIELNPEYCKLAERRIRGANPPLPLFEETP